MHDGLLGDLPGAEFGNFLAVAEDDDTMAVANHFFEVGGDEEDGHALGGQFRHQLFDLKFGADIDAAGGLVEQQQARMRSEPASEDDFLLIAAAEEAHGLLGAWRDDVQRLDELISEFGLSRAGT